MRVRVDTASPYDVHVAPGALEMLPDYRQQARLAVIYPKTRPELFAAVRANAPDAVALAVPDGEQAKTSSVLEYCWNHLAQGRFTRSDVILGIGGGTTTDLAGFVAATWLRGVRYLSAPTTVLAAVDAAVGGKTGINLPAGKNLVGNFYEPIAVLCDLALLRDLPQIEVRAGLAEVVKCGFIRDRSILSCFERDLTACQDVTSQTFSEVVARAIQVKADVVASDLRERTSHGRDVGREALNYGHTLGHAIEAREQYRWRHGHAISVGMCWIAEVSRTVLGLDQPTADLHRELLAELGLPTSYEGPFDELRQIMSVDKKARGGSLRLVGLQAQGHPSILSDVDSSVLREAFARLA